MYQSKHRFTLHVLEIYNFFICFGVLVITVMYNRNCNRRQCCNINCKNETHNKDFIQNVFFFFGFVYFT